jgi:plastocyanin
MRLLLLLLVVAAPVEAASLYDRLGGKAAVGALVDEWVTRAAADKRVKGRFLDVEVAHLKAALADHLCKRGGGACAAPDLPAALGRHIVDAEWQALLEDLDATAQKLNVAPADREELKKLLVSSEVVQPPTPEALKVDGDLVDKAKQLSSMLVNVGKVKAGELLELAVTARVRGQRSYAEYLYSLAEAQMKPGSLAVIAPLFRQGGPPRVTDALRTLSGAPQPPSTGSSDDDEAQPEKGSLIATLTVDKKPQFGVLTLSGTKKRPPRSRVVEIRGGNLQPHVTVVPVGSTVAFANFDPIFHNWFSLSPARPFDLGLYKNGEAREVTFDKEGVVRVSCDLHSHTAAYVIVVGAGYFAASDGAGHVTLKSVAPGRYKARFWSESGVEITQPITVRAGENQLALDARIAPAAAVTDKLGY